MKKIYLIFRYVKYLIKSKNEYFIHSPFVFDFLTKVIYQKGVSNITDDIEEELPPQTILLPAAPEGWLI